MKSKVFKKVAAFVTATTMAMGTFAVLPEEYLSEICLTVSAAEITASGQCGDNVFWELDENGTLTISGTGNMYEESGQPFYDYRAKIKQIIIKSGVTSISNSIFYHLYELTNVSIPDTVTSIGNSAFYQCEIITSISIPNSVTSIGDYAFTNCFALKNINIPFGVTVIDDYAFSNCRSLSNITIPNSIAKIGECSFYKCWELGNITIPDSVTSIGMGAFSDCEKMTNMIIPDSVNTMGDQVFESCSSLKSVKLSSKVSTISKQTFMNCSSLEEVIIPEGVTSIGEAAFIYCSNLKTVNLPSTLKTLDGWAFDSCSSITEINIPDGVTSIGQSAFRLCTSLTKATIPASVTSIGNYAFVGDDSLTIYGYKGTVAETYANENEIPFVALDSSVDPEPDEDYTQYLKFEFNKGEIIKFKYESGHFIPSSKEIEYFYGAYLIDTDEKQYGNDVVLSNITIKLIAPTGFSFDESGEQTTFSKDFAQLRLNTDDCSGMITLYPQKYTYPTVTLKAEVYVDNVIYKSFETKVGVSVNNSNAIDISEEYDETDSDGDGLPDVWEKYGITYRGEFLDLPAMGSDPNKPDIFVEVDFKDSINPNDYARSLKMVYKQFQNHGINLHIDAGATSVDYVTGKIWGNLSASNAINGEVIIDIYTDSNDKNDNPINKWKAFIDENFNNDQIRSVVFRYCIFGDEIKNSSPSANQNAVTYGFAAGIPHQYFFVAYNSLMNDKGLNAQQKEYKVALTFMHELGHTLGLHHGGINSKGVGDDTNNKPNYLSIMNYSFQNGGLQFYNKKIDDETGDEYYEMENFLEKGLNYSEFILPSINENKINENFGIDPYGKTDGTGIGSAWKLGNNQRLSWNPISRCAIDFNENEVIENSIKQNINGDTNKKNVDIYSILSDTTNDWQHIIIRTQNIGCNGSGLSEYINNFMGDNVVLEITYEEPEVIIDEHTHSYGTLWKSNSVSHWHECSCGEKTDIAQHITNSGVVTVQPTATTNGVKTYSCSVCGYVLRTETIPATGYIDYPSYPTYPTYPTYTPVTTTPSVFCEKLSVRAEISGGTVTLKWDEVDKADKYVVYQYKNGKYVKAKTTADTSVTFKKLKNGETYKFLVRYTINGRLSPTTYSGKITVKVYYKPIPKPTATKNSIKLTWEAVPAAKKYAVYKYVDGNVVKLTETTKLSVKIGKLSPDTEYKYIVRAYVDGKWTAMLKSDIVTVKTKAE